MNLLGWGLQTRSLKHAAHEVIDKINALCANHGSMCKQYVGCGGTRASRVTLVVQDAAAMYECVNCDMVLAALDAMIDRCSSEGHSGIMMRKCRGLEGWLSVAGGCVSPAFEFASWESIGVGMRMALALRRVRLGDRILFQRTGVPMGGLASDIAANLLLGSAEIRWQARGSHLYQVQGQGPLMAPAYPLVQKPGIDQIRYVDDVLTMSVVHREECRLNQTVAMHDP